MSLGTAEVERGDAAAQGDVPEDRRDGSNAHKRRERVAQRRQRGPQRAQGAVHQRRDRQGGTRRGGGHRSSDRQGKAGNCHHRNGLRGQEPRTTATANAAPGYNPLPRHAFKAFYNKLYCDAALFPFLFMP